MHNRARDTRRPQRQRGNCCTTALIQVPLPAFGYWYPCQARYLVDGSCMLTPTEAKSRQCPPIPSERVPWPGEVAYIPYPPTRVVLSRVISLRSSGHFHVTTGRTSDFWGATPGGIEGCSSPQPSCGVDGGTDWGHASVSERGVRGATTPTTCWN